MPRGPRTRQRSANRPNHSAAPRRSGRASTQAATAASVNPHPPRTSAATNAEPDAGSLPSADFSALLDIIRTQVRTELEAQSLVRGPDQQPPVAVHDPPSSTPAYTLSVPAQPALPGTYTVYLAVICYISSMHNLYI